MRGDEARRFDRPGDGWGRLEKRGHSAATLSPLGPHDGGSVCAGWSDRAAQLHRCRVGKTVAPPHVVQLQQAAAVAGSVVIGGGRRPSSACGSGPSTGFGYRTRILDSDTLECSGPLFERQRSTVWARPWPGRI